MTRTVQRGVFASLCTAGLLAVAFFAHAGAVTPHAVTFTGCPPSTVSGDLKAFRNSAAGGANYFAHCSLTATSSPTTLTASCSVGNYSQYNPGRSVGTCPNTHFTCTSTDAAIIDTVATLQSNSKLTVSVNNSTSCANGSSCTCTSVEVDNFSNDGVLTFGD